MSTQKKHIFNCLELNGIVYAQTKKGVLFLLSPEDKDLLETGNWHLGGHYIVRDGINPRTGNRSKICLHRYVAERIGIPDEMEADHINRFGLDNRRENLRPATHQFNGMNQKKRNTNKSGYPGICWDNLHGGWRVYVCGRQLRAHSIEEAIVLREKMFAEKLAESTRENEWLLKKLSAR